MAGTDWLRQLTPTAPDERNGMLREMVDGGFLSKESAAQLAPLPVGHAPLGTMRSCCPTLMYVEAHGRGCPMGSK